MIDWFPIRLSFAVAGAATLIALVAGSGLAWLLARKRFPGRNVLDALITLPLVLPPTVLGYYLLVLLGTRSALGGFLYNRLGIRLTFTVTAAIIAATIHALPLVTKSLRAAFEGVNVELESAARTLGLSNRLIFFRVTLPLASRGVLAATALAFARALVGGIQVSDFEFRVRNSKRPPIETSNLLKSSQWKRNMNSKLGTQNSEPVYASKPRNFASLAE